jgi:hypothetical protein
MVPLEEFLFRPPLPTRAQYSRRPGRYGKRRAKMLGKYKYEIIFDFLGDAVSPRYCGLKSSDRSPGAGSVAEWRLV